jgi:hypothetical protein
VVENIEEIKLPTRLYLRRSFRSFRKVFQSRCAAGAVVLLGEAFVVVVGAFVVVVLVEECRIGRAMRVRGRTRRASGEAIMLVGGG